MNTISSCLIVKNEIKNLPLLIDDLKQFCEEIIIVDTGSTDGTFEWLNEHSNDVLKVYTFEWINDFAAARNFSFSKANCDWIFWCDADDRIPETLINIINDTKKILHETPYNAFIMRYQFGVGCNIPRNRLLKRANNPVWIGRCHEYVTFDDLYTTTLGDEFTSSIMHQREHPHSERNLEIFVDQILDLNAELSYRDLYYYTNELRDNDMHKKSAELAVKFLMNFWNIDAYNAIMENIWEARWSKPEYRFEAIYYLDALLKRDKYLRGDIYYIRAIINEYLGNVEEVYTNCRHAINANIIGMNFSENIDFSKVLPAITLYRYFQDAIEKEDMLKIIYQYKDVSEIAKNFLRSLNIN